MQGSNYHWLQPRKRMNRTLVDSTRKASWGVTMSEKALRMPAEGVTVLVKQLKDTPPCMRIS